MSDLEKKNRKHMPPRLLIWSMYIQGYISVGMRRLCVSPGDGTG